MPYFTNFPYTRYDNSGTGGEYTVVKNIFRRISLRAKAKENALIFDRYDIGEGETPESIAYDHYNNSQLHWVILLTNDIHDRFYGWPLTDFQFEDFVKGKYSNINATHHYEISQSSGSDTKKINIGTDNTDYPTATVITNWEYELALQDELRKIRILKRSYLTQFVSEFETLITEIS